MPTNLELHMIEMKADIAECPKFVQMTVRELRDIANQLERSGGNRALDEVTVSMFVTPAAAREIEIGRDGIQSDLDAMDAFLGTVNGAYRLEKAA